MKKRMILFGGILLVSSFSIRGQNSEFEELLHPDAILNTSEFVNVKSGSLATADVDGDNDLDVLCIGELNGTRITKLYLNDGNANFTEVIETPFEAVSNGSMDFADIDDDGDQDLLIAGFHGSAIGLAKLYINDGMGVYTEVPETTFSHSYNGKVQFEDFDSDGDQDVFLTGYSNGSLLANLYLNDGTGNFTLLSNPFTGVTNSDFTIGDIDGDDDLDLLVIGQKSFSGSLSNRYSTKLYLNDGNGNFSTGTAPLSDGIVYGSVDFVDLDSDGDLDLFLSGRGAFNDYARTYFNDGEGNFSFGSSSQFTDVDSSAAAFADCDNDGDIDLVLSGNTGGNNGETILYLNDGTGNFTESVAELPDAFLGAVLLHDFNGDDYPELLVIGTSDSSLGIARLLLNNAGAFTEPNQPLFTGMYRNGMDVSDIDLDGDQDVLFTGTTLDGTQSLLYINEGNGVFTQATSDIVPVYSGVVEFADIDNDGDEDVLVMGFSEDDGEQITKLYRNTAGIFTEITENVLDGLYEGDAVFGDVDNDGDMDLITMGQNTSNERVTLLYWNDGTGLFAEEENSGLMDGFKEGELTLIDYDGNGGLDLFVTGINASNSKVLYVYDNSGNGFFNEISGAFNDGYYRSSQDFTDIDNDGDFDLIVTGVDAFNQRVTNLYTYSVGGFYQLVSGTTFDGSIAGKVRFVDLDKDGDQDIFLVGRNASNEYVAQVYLNDGTGDFTEDETVNLEGSYFGNMILADLDGDSFLDIVYSGLDSGSTPVTKVYKNKPYLGTNYYVSNPGQSLQDGSSIAHAAPKVSLVIDGALLRDSVKVVSGTVTETTDFTIPKNVHVWLDDNVSLDAGAQTITNNGHVTLSSTSSYVQSTGSVTGEGNFEVIRESGTEFSLYNLLASPVQNIDVQQVYGGSNVVSYDPAEQTNGSGGWSYVHSGNLQNGKGYAVNGALLPNFAGKRYYVGKPNNGEISFTLDGNTYGEVADGWNLIGNPYPSAIDMTTFLTGNPDVGAVTLYDQSQEMYVTYNLLNASGLSVASGQGFFVEFSLTNSGTATFTNAQRQQSAGTIERQSSLVKANLKIQNDEGRAYSTLVGFAGEASDGFDVSYDAKSMPGASDLLVYSLLDESPQAIQTFAALEAEKVVRIGVIGSTGNYEFLLEGFTGMDDVSVLLYDAEMETMHDLELDEYSFLHSFDGTDEDRFSLIFRKKILDVEDESVLEDVKIVVGEWQVYVIGEGLDFVSLYDVSGKRLLHGNVSDGEIVLSSVDIATGIYFIEYGLGGEFGRKKVQILK